MTKPARVNRLRSRTWQCQCDYCPAVFTHVGVARRRSCDACKAAARKRHNAAAQRNRHRPGRVPKTSGKRLTPEEIRARIDRRVISLDVLRLMGAV